jgi:hypothetical protein
MKTFTVCRHLRSKSMFIPALAHPEPGGETAQASSTSHCWCNCTLTETGPDDQAVGPERCRSPRACFEE